MNRICMRFPNGKTKALTLSYDDGVEQDIRLIEILNKYGLKATFNINSGCYAADGTVFPKGQFHRRLTEKQVTELYKNSGHEIAVHTSTHPFLEKLPISLAMKELLNDREALERQFGTLVRGMAYPYGTYNDEVVACAAAAGLVYGRTVQCDTGFHLPEDWLRLKATAHHDAPNLMQLAESFATAQPNAEPMLFYLWGHSYEFEVNDNWNVIERFGEYMGNREDIWYATNIEIYDYQQAFKHLIFAADGSFVYNPSSMPVCFATDSHDYCVNSGETLVDIK